MAERCDDIVSRCRLRLAEFAVAVLGLDPYDWQINTYEDINDYRRTAVVAANGSGKTVSLVCVQPVQRPDGHVGIYAGRYVATRGCHYHPGV